MERRAPRSPLPAPDSTLHAPRSTLTPLFEDASAALGGHLHTEAPFDDWEHQFLLPNALSQLGPGVAWFDVDRDGDEDLVVGAGRGGALTVFRNDGGRFADVSEESGIRVRAPALDAPRPSTSRYRCRR